MYTKQFSENLHKGVSTRLFLSLNTQRNSYRRPLDNSFHQRPELDVSVRFKLPKLSVSRRKSCWFWPEVRVIEMAFSINSLRSKIGEKNQNSRQAFMSLIKQFRVISSWDISRHFIGHSFDCGCLLVDEFVIGWRTSYLTFRAEIWRRFFDQNQHHWQAQLGKGDEEDWSTFGT